MGKTVEKAVGYELIVAKDVSGRNFVGEPYVIKRGTFLCGLPSGAYVHTEAELKNIMSYTGYASDPSGVTRGPYVCAITFKDDEVVVKQCKRYNVASTQLVSLDSYKER